MRSSRRAMAQVTALASHEAARASAVEHLSAFVQLRRWTGNGLRPAECLVLRIENGKTSVLSA